MRSLRAPEPLIALYLSTVAKVKAATKVTSVADLKEKHAFLDYCKVERSKLIAADPGLSQYKERKLLKDQWVKLDEAVKKVLKKRRICLCAFSIVYLYIHRYTLRVLSLRYSAKKSRVLRLDESIGA